jgi:PEP-CTERM motif
MYKRIAKMVMILALLMAAVTGPAVASVNLTIIGTAQISGGGATNYNLIYDSDQSLFWLDYSHGYANWLTSMNWANNLILTNILTPGYTVNLSGTGWRLPTTIPANPEYNPADPSPCEYNQTETEMGHLYYTDLGFTQGVGVPGVGSTNQLPFKNILSGWYWSGTEYAVNPYSAWLFGLNAGNQDPSGKDGYLFALSVRPGQLVSTVPEPSTYFLLCIGLGVVGYARRRMSTHTPEAC